MNTKAYKVEVTQLKISKPCIKIFAKVLNIKNIAALENLKVFFNQSEKVDITVGDVCIAHVPPDKYERVRVVQVNSIDRTASLLFIDGGFHGVYSINRLRILHSEKLRSMRPLCKEYILSEIIIAAPTCSDYKDQVKKLHDMIIGKEFNLIVTDQNEAGSFVDLRRNNSSLVKDIIPTHPIIKSYFKPIPLRNQMQLMLEKKIEKERNVNEQAYKVTLIESPEMKRKESAVEANQSVRISSFNDGPFSFFVHLIKNDKSYQKFQCDLQKLRTNLISIEYIPSAGTTCIADVEGQLNRVEIVHTGANKISQKVVTIQMLETGQRAIVEASNLFKMPVKVSVVAPFAKQFKLAGIDKNSVVHLLPTEIEFYFNHITNQKVLTLKERPGLSTITSCDLFDGDVKIVDEVKRWIPNALKYPPQSELKSSVYSVRICSVNSPQLFHVLPELPTNLHYESLYDSLRFFDPPRLRNPMVGDACIVTVDDHKMRGKIIGRSTSEILQVLIVDFGFVDDYHGNEIGVTVKEFLELPNQSYRCCLKGFEDVGSINETTIRAFEEICKSSLKFKMTIVKKNDETYVVTLEDSSTGAKVINSLKESRQESRQESSFHNRSDWTEAQASIRTQFKSRRHSNETVDTLTESPNRSLDWIDHHKSNDWDESVEKLTNSTLIGASALDWETKNNVDVAQKKKTSDDWWDLGVTELEVSFDEQDKPGLSTNEVQKHQSSPSSTSGVSSGSSEHHKGEGVRITAVINPTDFTIQKLSMIEEFEASKPKIHQLAQAQPPLTVFNVGTFCLAFHPFESKWCRAVILDADPRKFLVSVRCIDDGTSFSVEERSSLKDMSLQLSFKRSFGIRCSLPVVYDRRREELANKLLLNLMKETKGQLTFQKITEFNQVNFIELFHLGKNVSDQLLIEMNYAKRLVVVPTGPAYINNVISTSDFCIQMTADSDALNQIVQFCDSYVYQEVKSPKIGMLVVALDKNYVNWYRARILGKEKEEFRVYYLEHGHEATVRKIGVIKDQTIADIHPIGIKCSLVAPTGIRKFSQEAEETFKEMAQKGYKQFLVRLVKPEVDFAYVDVFTENENVLKKLLSVSTETDAAAAVTRETIEIESESENEEI